MDAKETQTLKDCGAAWVTEQQLAELIEAYEEAVEGRDEAAQRMWAAIHAAVGLVAKRDAEKERAERYESILRRVVAAWTGVQFADEGAYGRMGTVTAEAERTLESES